MHRTKIAVLLALSTTMTAPSLSAAAADNSAVTTRQANFKQMGGAFKAINDELKKDAPDLAVVRTSAVKVANLAPQLPRWFPKGSGPETGMKMAAKPEVWTDPADFAAAAKGLQAETAKLQQISTAGDLDAIKAQTKATGGACKTCHTKYRLPEQH